MIKKNIPNAITCVNLLCGCVAIFFAYNNRPDKAAWLIGAGAILDFFDGFAARMLKVHAAIGKQLDSLADVVTFGVAPGAIIFMLMQASVTLDNAYLAWISFIIPVFSALRLAKFNIDTRQSDSFIGVPTPANAILIASLPLIAKFHSESMRPVIYNINSLVLLTTLMSLLLVSELPLFALKFKNFSWNANRNRYVFLSISLVLLILFQFIAIPIIVLLYVILSVISNSFFKK